jgi:hypothetical protein
MKLQTALFYLTFCSMMVGVCNAQKSASSANSSSQSVKSSPAFAEVLLRETELESEVESLLASYTEDFPKVRESRYELSLIQKDLQKILIQTDTSKLTLALGKLIVRRAELGTNVWILQSKYGDEHPEVKRAKKKLLFFNNAIKEILP